MAFVTLHYEALQMVNTNRKLIKVYCSIRNGSSLEVYSYATRILTAARIRLMVGADWTTRYAIHRSAQNSTKLSYHLYLGDG